MENSIYLVLSRQSVLKNNMDIIANNVANMNTPGFRAQNLVFSEYIEKIGGEEKEISFVRDNLQYQDTSGGPMEQTENPFDVALVGPGFITIDGPDGQPAYTRAGNLQIGTDGTLQTSAGFQVSGGIEIPEGATQISIDENGIISSADGEIGSLQIVEFENLQNLEPMGNNLYKTDAAPGPATETKVKQGYIEGSNVNAVLEMTRMIETLRNYQSIHKTMEGEHERLRNAISKLTRSS